MKSTNDKARPLPWEGFQKPVRAQVGLFRLMGKGLGLLGEALLNAIEVLLKVFQFLEERFTLTLFTLWGVPVSLHWTLLLFASGLVGGGLGVSLFSGNLWVVGAIVIMLLIAFGSILLHELGHVMVARFYGVPTQSISLHVFGSTSLFKDPILKPSRQFVISIAGPLVNVLLVGAAYGILYPIVGPDAISPLGGSDLAKLEQYPWLFPIGLVYVFNVIILVLSLLPVYPMDGSRILRSLLEMPGIPTLYATYIVGGISVLFLGLLVLIFNLPLIITILGSFVLSFFMNYEIKRAKILSQKITPYILSVKEYLSDVESEVALRKLEPLQNTDVIAQLDVEDDDIKENLKALIELNRLVYTMAKLSKSMRTQLGIYKGFVENYPEPLEERVARYYDEAVQAAPEQTESESIDIASSVAKRVLAEELSFLLYGDSAAADVRLIEEPLQEAKVIQEKCIEQTATVRSAYLKMQERNLDYLVVLDEENRIVGVIVRRELAEVLSAA